MKKWLYAVLLVVSSTVLAQDKPLTNGFNHVGLTVTDLQSSVDFFIDTLGWRVTGGDDSYPAKFGTDGDMFLTLWQVKYMKKAKSFERKHTVGLHHLAFIVDRESQDEINKRVQKIDGVVIEIEPELAYGGPGKHMLLREPGGNHLNSAAGQSSHCCLNRYQRHFEVKKRFKLRV